MADQLVSPRSIPNIQISSPPALNWVEIDVYLHQLIEQQDVAELMACQQSFSAKIIHCLTLIKEKRLSQKKR